MDGEPLAEFRLSTASQVLEKFRPRQEPTTLASADLVVIPSICQDAMPLTARQAMAAGTPVVASRIGGLPFSVVDGVTGRLVRPGDARDLAECLADLLRDPVRISEMGRAARERVENEFNWELLYERSYRSLLA
jgi:glycosyltransferase involved in cell wall biosynthesis